MILRRLDKEAKRIVTEVLSYISYDCDDENSLFSTTCKILGIDEKNQNQELIAGIKKYCINIEGICYFIALNFRIPEKMIKLRCAQFVNRIDYYLYQSGVKPCSKENKKILLEYCDLCDIYTQSPSLFSEYNNIITTVMKKYEKAHTFIIENKYHEAIEIYNDLLNIVSNSSPIFLDRGYAFFCLKEYDNAIENYTKVIQKDPNEGNIYYLRAGAYFENNDYLNAIADFTKGLEYLPDNAEALFKRGSAYSHINEFDMAISDLTQSINIDANNADAFMCRAWCYAKIKKEMNFREDILKVAKLDPSLEEGLKDKYKLYFTFDEIRIALRKYDKDVEKDYLYKKAVELLQSLSIAEDIKNAKELCSIVYINWDISERLIDDLLKNEIPIILVKNKCIYEILSRSKDLQKRYKLMSNLECLYKKNNEIIGEYFECLSLEYYHNQKDYLSKHYYNLMEQIYTENIGNKEIASIFAKCTEYGTSNNIELIKYNEKLIEIYDKNKDNVEVGHFYAKYLYNFIKNTNSIYVKNSKIKTIEEIYRNGNKEVAKILSDSLYHIILLEDSSELIHTYLKKMENLEDTNGKRRSYEYINSFIHYISHDLTEEQKRKINIHKASTKGHYVDIDISFMRNNLIIYFDEERCDSDGDSLFECLDIHIVDSKVVYSIADVLFNSVNLISKETFSEIELDFFNNLENSNVKKLFHAMISIYQGNPINGEHLNFIQYLDKENLPYMYSHWVR